MWVHKSENTHTYTDSRRWDITALPSLQQNSDSISSHPSSHHPLCLPSCWITNTLRCCSGKRTERKGLTFFLFFLSQFSKDVKGKKMRKRRKEVWRGFKRLEEEGVSEWEVDAADIHAALLATKETCLLTLMLLDATSRIFRRRTETFRRDERKDGTR